MTPRCRERAPVASAPDNYLRRRIEVGLEAERLIGKRAWAMVSTYGRLVDGPYTGLYVSGVPLAVQLDLVRRLRLGETVSVHLMHRHVSGHYEPSALRWSESGGLVMAFEDRDEMA